MEKVCGRLLTGKISGEFPLCEFNSRVDVISKIQQLIALILAGEIAIK